MIFAQGLRRCPLRVLSLALGLAASLIATAARAQTVGPDIYLVSGIETDVEAESAAAARDLAMEEAQREGLRRLLHRLTSTEFYGDLPPIDGISLARVVKSIEVEEEQVAATRYLATISVAYSEEAIQGILRSAGVPSVLTPSEPILIVPVLQQAGRPALWDEAGPWRDAWWQEVDRNTVLRLVLPLGDLTDVTTLKPAQLDADGQAMLAAMADRYGAEAALLAQATPEPGGAAVRRLMPVEDEASDETAPAVMEVDVPQAWNWPFEFNAHVVATEDPDDPEQIWRDGVRSIIEMLERDWKRLHLIRYDQVSTLAADVPIDRLERWIEVRRMLLELPEVRDVSVDSFSQTLAEVTIRHVGDLSRLGQGLERRGLELRPVEAPPGSPSAIRWQLLPLTRELPQGFDTGPDQQVSPSIAPTILPAPEIEN